MSNITGFYNEYLFVEYLNNKRINELNPRFRELIDALFHVKDEKAIIKCWKNHLKQKFDILIKIDNEIKRISLKIGNRNSVHVEPITEFIHFLISNGVSRNSVMEYLKYHYADGTTNGTGKKRLSAEEYKNQNQDKIDLINTEINNEKLVKEAIDRFILKGTNSYYSIDAIIHGEVNDFLWISREDIINIILKKINLYSSAVHFGSMTVQPKNRCLNYNMKYNKDRFCIQIKWYNLFDDIIENMYFKERDNINLPAANGK